MPWRVERRWVHETRSFETSKAREAWDVFHVLTWKIRRGTLHLINPQGREVIWCKASDVWWPGRFTPCESDRAVDAVDRGRRIAELQAEHARQIALF
jgi:hypothetical protein